MAAMTRRPTMLLLLLLALLFCVALSQRNHEEYGGPVIHPPGTLTLMAKGATPRRREEGEGSS